MRVVVFTVALSIAAIVTPVAAQTAPPATPKAAARRPAAAALAARQFRPILRELRGVNLTAEQRQQIKEAFKSHQPELKAFAEKFRAARQGWQQAGQINIQQRKDLLAERMTIMKGIRDQVFGLLTPEQQKQIQARPRRRAPRG